MLFNEPKLLKSVSKDGQSAAEVGFSALQRAEIAEIPRSGSITRSRSKVSVLFNEPKLLKLNQSELAAEIAAVSVLFNEPKLLKSIQSALSEEDATGFSALQRAEIAEIVAAQEVGMPLAEFQCSSTSRNC